MCQEVLDGLGAVNRRAVPDDEEFAGDVMQQMAQEAHNIRAFVGALLAVQEEVPVRRDGAYDGDVVPRERDAQERRLPARGVRPYDTRQQVEAGFINPDDGPSLLLGLLF